MLTRSLSNGIMAAPEHLSRRDRVRLFYDHLAVLTHSTPTCDARLLAANP